MSQKCDPLLNNSKYNISNINNAIIQSAKNVNILQKVPFIITQSNGPKWFDKECSTAKNKSLNALHKFRRTPRNSPVYNYYTNKYVEARTNYSNIRKVKSASYYNNIKTEIINSKNDSKKFWSALNVFRENKFKHVTKNISKEKWFDHYSNIFNPDNSSTQSNPLDK